MDRGDGFDLVLMDIDLGDGMDGTEAARQILLRRNVPIAFLTSHMEKEYVDRAKAISSYGYVVKDTGEVLAAATQYPKACRVDISILGAEREVRHVDPLIEVAIEVDTYADLAGVVVPPPLS